MDDYLEVNSLFKNKDFEIVKKENLKRRTIILTIFGAFIYMPSVFLIPLQLVFYIDDGIQAFQYARVANIVTVLLIKLGQALSMIFATWFLRKAGSRAQILLGSGFMLIYYFCFFLNLTNNVNWDVYGYGIGPKT